MIGYHAQTANTTHTRFPMLGSSQPKGTKAPIFYYYLITISQGRRAAERPRRGKGGLSRQGGGHAADDPGAVARSHPTLFPRSLCSAPGPLPRQLRSQARNPYPSLQPSARSLQLFLQVPRRFNDLTKALPPSRYGTPLPSSTTNPGTNSGTNPAAFPAEAADVSPPKPTNVVECQESVAAYKAAYTGYVERLAQQAHVSTHREVVLDRYLLTHPCTQSLTHSHSPTCTYSAD